ncbi:MAG: enoyl-CoA hydratase-related protein [Nannocystaceae bacterium]
MRPSIPEIQVTSEPGSGIRVVRFCRPAKKNAFTTDMYARLADVLLEAGDDGGCRVLLLCGSEGVFSAGNDLRDFADRPPADAEHPVFRMLAALANCEVPLVAAVEGSAVGIGTTVLLHCDFAYAEPNARFRVPFVDLGVCPEAASSLLLPLLVGRRRAAELLLLGDWIDGAAAAEIGLVTRLCPVGEAWETALEVARRLAAKPRDALRVSKRLMLDAWREPVRDIMRREGEAFLERLGSAEAQQAFAAFLGRGSH